jgi:type II secretory pathway pseudopilin PulG
MRPPEGEETGTTLVEVLVAVVVLAIAAGAIIGGLLTSITVSDVHRKQATAGAVARDYAEMVAGTTYVDCAGTAAYAVAPAAVPVPSEFVATIASVEYWTGSAWTASCASDAGSDAGLQRITVVASSADGRATERSVVVVRKP